MLVVTCTCPMQSYVPIVHEPAKIQAPTRGKAVTPTKELLINSPKSRTNPPSPKDQLRYVIYVHTYTHVNTRFHAFLFFPKKKKKRFQNERRTIPSLFLLVPEVFASLCMSRDAKFPLPVVVFMALRISSQGYPINLRTRHC